VHKFPLFALCIIDRIIPSVSLQYPTIFSILCSITHQFLYNLFLFFSLFFFKSYYFISLNQVKSHFISNKLLKKSFEIHFTNQRKCSN
jgi:hypothetical protein